MPKPTSLAIIAVLLATLIVAAGCSPSREVALGAKDDGRRVEIDQGRTLAITLESNPTTGYLWEVVELDEGILRQMEEAEFKPKSELVGAPGTQTFRFQARGTGDVTLRLVHHRTWEKDKDPLETFSLHVVVR